MRLKIHWFSPLPPARTDIAHYTARILPALAAQADVTLWTDAPEWDRALENYAEVRSYSLETVPWPELHRGDMTFFNLGNNREFHENIYHLCRLHPGIVVVHDFSIHHLIAGLYRDKWRNLAEYRDHLTRYHGRLAGHAADAYWREKFSTEHMAARFPMIGLGVENAIGIMTHTRQAFEALRAEHPQPITFHPLPYALSTRAPIRPPRLDGRCRLIVFGHLGPNRRIETTLRALHGHRQRERFELRIYGQVVEEAKIRALIAELHLEDCVELHGFVPDEVLAAALDRADLAINLRFPTMGEASGSQLRIWAHALPTIVTRIGWYGDLSPDAVGFVRMESEIQDLQGHLDAILANPAQFRRMGEIGRRLLESQHTPESYAAAIVQLATEASAFRRPAGALKLVQKVAPLVADLATGKDSDALLRRVATEVAFLTAPQACTPHDPEAINPLCS